MDDNTRAVLVTAIQVGGGFLLGLIGAYVGRRWARTDVREQQARDDRIRSEDLARLASEASRQDRQAAIERFAEQLERAGPAIAATDHARLKTALDTLTELNAALAAMRLVAPDLDEAAGAAYDTTYDVGILELRQPPASADERKAARSTREHAKAAFIAAARAALEH